MRFGIAFFALRCAALNFAPTRSGAKLKSRRACGAIHPSSRVMLDSSRGGKEPNSSFHLVKHWLSNNFFVLGMATAVVSAAVVPQLGMDGSFLRPELTIGNYGVSFVFLLSGLSLRLSELREAVLDVRLNLLTQSISMGLIPIASYAVIEAARHIPWLPIQPKLLDGLILTSCLPTTVNMCVILTQSAGGNVAAALTNAVLGNMLGVFVSPALLLLTLKKDVALSFADIFKRLAVKVIIPVFIGQLLRLTSMRTLQTKYKGAFKRMFECQCPTIVYFVASGLQSARRSEVMLLLIMWNTFSTSFERGLNISAMEIAALGVSLSLLHAGALVGLLSALTSPIFDLSARDAVASTYVASQKTLAFGIPLIKCIFGDSPNLAFYSAPIMLLHPAQLLLGSAFVPMFKRKIASSTKNGKSD